MLCVNRTDKSGCNGDSGGPLFVYDQTGATPPVQVGVVSWGSSACIGTPSVLARVSEEITWINSYIDLWSGGGEGGPAPTPTPPGTCTNDPSFSDSFGDDCSWYEEFDPTCSLGGCCENGSGTANTACCICGGGITSPTTPTTPITPAPVTPVPATPAPVTTAPVGSGICTNDPSFSDSFGDDCSWYEANDPTCSLGGCCENGSGTANTACCICGGGITPPTTPTTPAPVTPVPVTTPPSPTPESGTIQDAIDRIEEALEILEPVT